MFCFLASLGGLAPAVQAAQEEVPVTVSDWQGYRRLDFKVEERSAWLVVPKTAAAGNPWIWRTEFFGHEPQADLVLLEKGFHVAYIDVRNLYGAPVAIAAMDRFYDQVTKNHSLSRKTVLEGFSRGGLFAFNWAAANPSKVACLYVDAPVCDFKSWPGGKGKGKGSAGDWKKCLAAYDLSEERAVAYPLNPIDRLEPLAAARIPILAVCGGADEVVPLEENMAIVQRRYRELGGQVELIVKPGGGHHPHSLKDPAPIVDFVLRNTVGR